MESFSVLFLPGNLLRGRLASPYDSFDESASQQFEKGELHACHVVESPLLIRYLKYSVVNLTMALLSCLMNAELPTPHRPSTHHRVSSCTFQVLSNPEK